MEVSLFISLREEIEQLIKETKKWIKGKSIQESSSGIKKLYNKLLTLNSMVENDTQKRVIQRLKQEIEIAETQIEEIYSKREAGKKQDGNIAFKCNWNDNKYKAPCSDEAYNINLVQGRAWCSHPLSRCRTYTKEVTLANNPCYESIALKEMFFGAGWDISGDEIKYRRIHHARVGRIALLTTRPHFTQEEDRIIVGCLYIDRIIDDPGTETKIFGDKEQSIVFDYDNIRIKFWDYYKNPDAEDSIFWGTGLFRYISNRSVLDVLKDIRIKLRDAGEITNKVEKLINYYNNLNV